MLECQAKKNQKTNLLQISSAAHSGEEKAAKKVTRKSYEFSYEQPSSWTWGVRSRKGPMIPAKELGKPFLTVR